MKCHLCDAASVDRCYTCGQLFCEQHGKINCASCDNGIAAGDPRPDRVTARRRAAVAPKNAWWRPQEAQDFVPPSCYACNGLTRNICTSCGRRFCDRHSGGGGTCRECKSSATVGFAIGLGAIGAILLVFLAAAMWGRFQ